MAISKKTHNSTQSGFTLVEMSIVLVIIGLIVGGVLVGQDLVKAAQVRAVTGQIANYDAAVNTFRNKYGGMPGDFTKASSFLGAINGNGNSRLDDGSSVNVTTGFVNELQQFWLQLSLAQMVSGAYTAAGAAPSIAGTNIPETKLKKGSIVMISEGSINYWLIGSASSVANATSTLTDLVGNLLTPVEAFGIDSKVDDGVATSGVARAIHLIATTAITPESSGANDAAAGADCIIVDDYDIVTAATSNVCTLYIRSAG